MLLVVPSRAGGRNRRAARPAVVHSLWCCEPGSPAIRRDRRPAGAESLCYCGAALRL